MHTFVLHRASGSLAVMDSEHSHNVLAELIRQADPAAELSTRLVTHLACVLEPVLSKSTAVYGRETAIQELVPFPQHCHVCKARLAECRSSAAATTVATARAASSATTACTSGQAVPWCTSRVQSDRPMRMAQNGQSSPQTPGRRVSPACHRCDEKRPPAPLGHRH